MSEQAEIPDWLREATTGPLQELSRVIKEAMRRADAALLDQCGRVLHDAYEAAARESGWVTHEASRRPWEEVPEPNRAAARAGILAVFQHVAGMVTAEPAPRVDAAGVERAARELYVQSTYGSRTGAERDWDEDPYAGAATATARASCRVGARAAAEPVAWLVTVTDLDGETETEAYTTRAETDFRAKRLRGTVAMEGRDREEVRITPLYAGQPEEAPSE